MPVVAQQPQKGGRNPYQSLFLPNSLSPSRPTAKKRTVVRLIPAVASDGSILPTVQAMTPVGPDISNIAFESTTIMAGFTHKWTGLNKPSDLAVAAEFDMIFPGAFIRLKSMLKKNKTFPTSELKLKVMEMLTAKNEHGAEAFQRPAPMGYLQAIVTEFNGEVLPKPFQYQCVMLTEAAARSLSKLIEEEHKKGIDVCAPATGKFLVIDGIPPMTEGNPLATWRFRLTFTETVPLTETQCRKLWVPWEKVFNRTTHREQFLALVKAIGADVAQFVYPDFWQQYCAGQTTVVTPPAASAAPASVARPSPAVTPAPAPASQAPVALQLDLDAGPQELPGMSESSAPTPTPAARPTSVANAAAHRPPLVAELEREVANLLGLDEEDDGTEEGEG